MTLKSGRVVLPPDLSLAYWLAMQRGLGRGFQGSEINSERSPSAFPHERLHQDSEASRAEDSTYLLKVLNASIPLQSNSSEV